jgi:DNA polymerase-1
MSKLVAIDTETTGLYYYKGHTPFLFIAAEEGQETIVSKNVNDILHFFDNEEYEIVFHNAKFDLSMLKTIDIDVSKLQGRVHDTTILAHLIDSEQPVNLDFLSRKYLGENKLSDSVNDWFSQNKIKKEDRNYADVPDEIMIPYASKDAELTLKLYKVLSSLIEEQDNKTKSINIKLPLLENIYRIERKLIFVLLDMYIAGILVNIDYYRDLEEELEIRAYDLEQEIYFLAEGEFNMKSTKQLATILKEQGATLETTEKGNYIVDEDALKKIDLPIAKTILEYRKTQKTIGTYIKAMYNFNVNGVIHPNLNTNGARTGRFSCSDPNMQNIPRDDKSIKGGFMTKEGYYTVFMDYKQQEYRLFADYINDLDMINEINNGADFHTIIYEKNKKYLKDRLQTKGFNFLLIYGGGAGTLSQFLGISVAQAKELKESYFKEIPKAKTFFNTVDLVAKQRNYLINKFGRIKKFYDKFYIGPNFLIQGGCADLVKERMVEVWEFLKPYKSEMIFQIHDELVFNIHKDELYLIEQLKKILLDTTHVTKVIMDVDVEYTEDNWANKKEYKGVI